MHFRIPACCAAAALLCTASLMHGAPARSARNAAPATVAPAAPLPLPESVFTMPENPREGRDPFFPGSNRPYQTAAPVKPQQTSPSPDVSLVWNGVSGTAENRLVMINGRTFARGDEHTFNLTRGHVTVRCVEIGDDAVIVEVGGQRRVLRRPTEL